MFVYNLKMNYTPAAQPIHQLSELAMNTLSGSISSPIIQLALYVPAAAHYDTVFNNIAEAIANAPQHLGLHFVLRQWHPSVDEAPTAAEMVILAFGHNLAEELAEFLAIYPHVVWQNTLAIVPAQTPASAINPLLEAGLADYLPADQLAAAPRALAHLAERQHVRALAHQAQNNELFQRLQLERLVSTISGEFMDAKADEIDSRITQSLQRIAKFLKVDRAFIFCTSNSTIACSHEWAAAGVMPIGSKYQTFLSDTYDWLKARARRLEPIICNNQGDLADKAEPLRQFFTEDKLQALLLVPMHIRGNLQGYMGVGCHDSPHNWSDSDALLVQMTSQIFQNALHRREISINLYNTNHRLGTIIDRVPIITFTLDAQAKITFLRGNGLGMIGVTDPDYFLGMSVNRLYRNYPGFLDACNRALQGETVNRRVVLQGDPDSHRRPLAVFTADETITQSGLGVFDAWFMPIRNNHEIIGVAGVALNTTDYHNAELERLEEQQFAEALGDAVQAMNNSLNPEEVMNRILENVQKVVPNQGATIYLYEGDICRLAYAYSEYPVLPSLAKIGFTLPKTAKTQRIMIETGQPYRIDDTYLDPGWIRVAGFEWTQAYLGVPISINGLIIGSLNLDSDKPNYFNDKHVERLKVFANQAGLALKNAQVFDRMRESASQLASLHRATRVLQLSLSRFQSVDEICQRITQTVVNEFGMLYCAVLLVGENGDLRRVAKTGDYDVQATVQLNAYGRGLVPHAVRTGDIAYASDTLNDPHYIIGDPRTRSEVVLPLITSGGVIGVLDLQSTEIDAFSDNDQRVLAAFAERAATVIENLGLYQQSLTYASDLEMRVQERTETLERERAQLNVTLGGMSEGVVYGRFGLGGMNISYANPAMLDIFAIKASTQLNFDLGQMLEWTEDPETVLNKLRDILQYIESIDYKDKHPLRSPSWSYEVRLKRADGSVFDAYITITIITKITIDSFDAVMVVRDISKEKQLREQRDRFIANASHELRTPLTNFKTRLYLMRNKPERMNDHMRVLEDVANRMQQLVEGLLDVSRFEKGVMVLEKKLTNFSQLVRSAIETQGPHAEEKGLELTATLPEHDVEGYIDEMRIVQVMTNLITNAINYTPSGGKVLLTLAETKANGGGSQRKIVLTISDTGVGIQASLHHKIFEPFFRAPLGNVRGTGLGLAISRDIVLLHGGTIDVESAPKTGTTFTITLPNAAH
jgi:signal transduction histidine kinase